MWLIRVPNQPWWLTQHIPKVCLTGDFGARIPNQSDNMMTWLRVTHLVFKLITVTSTDNFQQQTTYSFFGVSNSYISKETSSLSYPTPFDSPGQMQHAHQSTSKFTSSLLNRANFGFEVLAKCGSNFQMCTLMEQSAKQCPKRASQCEEGSELFRIEKISLSYQCLTCPSVTTCNRSYLFCWLTPSGWFQ